jgi:hypothetical protein
MGSGSENAIDGMLVGANKVRTGSDANGEARDPRGIDSGGQRCFDSNDVHYAFCGDLQFTD